MSFTAKETRILKEFVKQVISTRRELRKTDGKKRTVNFNKIIENTAKEE